MIDPFPIQHPMRRPSDDEMRSRGLCDLMDPDAVLPETCSICNEPASFSNPLMLVPVDSSMKSLARCYLYRSVCAHCRERAAKRR